MIGKVILVILGFIGIVILLTSFGLSIHNTVKVKEINNTLKKDKQDPPPTTENGTISIYVYNSDKQASARNSKSLVMNDALINLFNIDMGDTINVNIARGYNDLMDVIFEHLDDHHIIISSNLGSQDVIDMITHISQEEKWDDIFYIIPASTADDPFLNSKNVLRLYQKDNEDMASIFIQRTDSITADHTILIVDEDDGWAVGLADLIQSVATTSIPRLAFKEDVILPNGSMNVILLSLNVYPLVFDILEGEDIRSLTLGDGSYKTFPSTQEELDDLQSWNTRVIVSEQGYNVPEIYNDIKQVINDDTFDLSSSTTMTSSLQIQSYLKNVIANREDFNEQYYIIGFQFDEELSGIAKVFYGCGYSKVGLYPDIIDRIYPVNA